RFSDGSWSQFVSVVDLERLRRISGGKASTTKRAPDVVDVFGENTSLMSRLLDTFADMGSAPVRSPSRFRNTQRKSGSGATYQSWDEYLDRCHERLGGVNLSFALGLPIAAGSVHTGAVTYVDWD